MSEYHPNSVTGEVYSLPPAQQIQGRNGQTYAKRNVVLRQVSYNQRTGDPIENYAEIEFFGNSSTQLDAQWETTLSVLKELGAEEKKIIVVFNKIDLVDRESEGVLFARLRGLFPDALYLSTRTGEGIGELKKRLTAIAAGEFQLMRVKLPPQRYDLAALAHANGRVYEENYNDSGELELVFTIGPALRHKFQEYAI